MSPIILGKDTTAEKIKYIIYRKNTGGEQELWLNLKRKSKNHRKQQNTHTIKMTTFHEIFKQLGVQKL
jgi:hypothetical protein